MLTRQQSNISKKRGDAKYADENILISGGDVSCRHQKANEIYMENRLAHALRLISMTLLSLNQKNYILHVACLSEEGWWRYHLDSYENNEIKLLWRRAYAPVI